MREIVKAFLKTGSGSSVNLLMGMVAMKVVAVILGPSGVGLYSLLRQTIDFCRWLGTMGGETALVQGLSSSKGQVQDDYLRTTVRVFALGALLVSAALVLLAPWIASWVFDSNDAQTITMVRWLAVPGALWVAWGYLNGVLNGFRAIGMLALIHALGAAGAALLAYPVSRLVEVGYPIAFIVMTSATPAIGVTLALWATLRAGLLSPLFSRDRQGIHAPSLRDFVSFAGPMLLIQLVIAGALLAMRSLIMRYAGLDSAGYFALAWTLSLAYLTLVLTSFGTYFLPTLSGLNDPTERDLLIRKVVRLATLVMVPLVTSVVVLKPLVIDVLYTNEFTPALEIIRWMLLGDYFKITSWIFYTTALAAADMKVAFWAELFLYAGFLALGTGSLILFGSLEGIGFGFLAVYVVYFAFYLYYVCSRHGFTLTKGMVASWLLGLLFVSVASWQVWSKTHVDWTTAPLWICAAAIFSWFSLGRKDRAKILHVASKRWQQ